jgi:hypothetical protein
MGGELPKYSGIFPEYFSNLKAAADNIKIFSNSGKFLRIFGNWRRLIELSANRGRSADGRRNQQKKTNWAADNLRATARRTSCDGRRTIEIFGRLDGRILSKNA